MTSPQLEPHKLARLDQWNAYLDTVVGHTVTHLAEECAKPTRACVGAVTSELIDGMAPVEAKMLLEIAIVRIAEQRTAFIYEPSFHCWVPNRPGEDVDDHEHDSSIPCDWGWICNADGCTVRTDTLPCPRHAPVHVPELRLTECQAEPRHWLWAHRNDDYGHGCPLCWVDQKSAELEPLQRAQQLREHRWCWLTNRLKNGLAGVGLIRITGWCSDCRYRMWHVSARWRWTR